VAAAGESRWARWLGVLWLSRRQLQQRWLESLLIVLGLALGVGVLTAGETFVRYQQTRITEALASTVLEWRAVVVRPRAAAPQEQFFGENAVPAVRITPELMEEPAQITLEDVLVLRREIPGVAYVTLGLGGIRTGSVVSVGNSPAADVQLNLEMVTPDEFAFRGLEFLAGGPFTWDDFVAGQPTLVLDADSAARLFPHMAPEDWIGQTITEANFGAGADGGGMVWRVVGIAKAPEDSLAAAVMRRPQSGPELLGFQPATAGRFPPAPVGAALDRDRTEITFQQVYVTPLDERGLPDLIAEIEAYFGQKYGPGRVEARNPLDERAEALGQLGSIVTALLVLAGLGLFIAAVNVLNLFTARVLRRQRFTGMSIALGATRRLLFWQTASEALLLGAAGSALGLLLAAGLVAVFRGALMAQASAAGAPAMEMYAAFRLAAPDVLVGLAAGMGLSLIFGLYPAWLGSHQDPVEALRVE